MSAPDVLAAVPNAAPEPAVPPGRTMFACGRIRRGVVEIRVASPPPEPPRAAA